MRPASSLSVVSLCTLLTLAVTGYAQQPSSILFTNVRVFDGKSLTLSAPENVLVTGNLIAAVSTAPIAAPGATVLEGNGKVLMPGMIDAHWHTFLAASGPAAVKAGEDPAYLHLVAAAEAKDTLLRGFTTVRDAGGPSFALKRAIDEDLLPGPRIYPSGALITQTGGHGDFRGRGEANPRYGGAIPLFEQEGMSTIADGPDQVLTAVREQLRLGASQIKLATTGGVASELDPLDSLQFTSAEIHAAVEAASDWGTYVMVHNYSPEGAKRAIEAGVKCIEHGQLLDEDSMKLIAEKGIWLDMQPFLPRMTAEVTPEQKKSPQYAKSLLMTAGTDNAYKLAKKYHVKLAWGTDITAPGFEAAKRENDDLALMLHWFSSPEILKMVTGTNGELMALSGKRNPYPKKLGVIEEGAYADLLLVQGNPVEDIKVLTKPDTNLLVIVKNGEVVKNILK